MPHAPRRVSSGLLALMLAGCGDDDVAAVCADASFDPNGIVEEWAFTAAGAHTIPLVADLDGDGIPEVVVNATRDNELGEITLLDGATGAQKWRITDDPTNGRFGAHGTATAAIADFDGDGDLDIVYAGRAVGQPADYSQIHAVDATGALLWSSHSPAGELLRLRVEHGAFAVANLDDDPNAEVVIGATILDHDGTVVAQASATSSVLGSPFTRTGGLTSLLYPGSLASVADVDGDGYPEIVTGRDAWKIDWAAGSPPTVTLTQLWQNTDGAGGDGWPSLADLDDDGDPEVVLVAWPDIRVLDARTGRLWCGIDSSDADCLVDPSRRTAPVEIADSLGGPATLADFDGDGRIEAGVAGGSAYTVYDFHRPDEEVVVPAGARPPAPGATYVRWSLSTQDQSSASTGSSVFDLDGDAIPEVFYQDECERYILDGATGEARHRAINSSFTIHEYPIVADVDGDGATEFLVIANASDKPQNTACQLRVPGFTTRTGVFLYGPESGRWAPAAPFWTQYGFHITDADADAHVPAQETAPWAEGGPNSVRQAAAVACE